MRTRAISCLAVLFALARVPAADACDTGSCPMLTQSQDSVRTRGSFGVDVSFRSMRHDRYVGRVPSTGITALSVVPGVKVA